MEQVEVGVRDGREGFARLAIDSLFCTDSCFQMTISLMPRALCCRHMRRQQLSQHVSVSLFSLMDEHET